MTGRRHPPPMKAPPQKRARQQSTEQASKPHARSGKAAKAQVQAPAKEQEEMCKVLHQVGYVGGGGFYDSKAERLQQILERLPHGSGAVAIFAEATSLSRAKAAVERYRRSEEASCARAVQIAARRKVATPCSASWQAEMQKAMPVEVHVIEFSESVVPASKEYGVVINYDTPRSAKDYLLHLGALHLPVARKSGQEVMLQAPPKVAYSFIEESKLHEKGIQELRALFTRARNTAVADRRLGGIAKAIEFDSVLEQLELGDEETAGKEEEHEATDDEDEGCDCNYCRGGAACTSYHTPMMALRRGPAQSPGVEAVRIHLRELEDLKSSADLIAPRVSGHVGTVICLHCMNVHNPWDGWEHLFAVPDVGGTLRIVFLLADECSWHDYPDLGTLGAGGVPWMDILDVESMEHADALLERLIDHEAHLLGGRSERVVLMGMSQGGGQSLLRFLRSQKRLGGWIGSVCHAPTAPHTPRDRDPLLLQGRSCVNHDRPIRFLAGEEDSVFPPGLVLRDAERLRCIGGFRDVEVEVQRGMSHTGAAGAIAGTGEAKAALLRLAQQEVPELIFMRKHLPQMLGASQTS